MSSALAPLLSPYVGIARSLDEVLAQPSDCGLPSVACELASDPRVLGVGFEHVEGVSGVELDRDRAAAAALGELAERYSLCYVPWERLVVSRSDELEGAAEPASFGLFSAEQYARPQFPFRPFTPELEVTWVEGRELPSGSRAWVPAELVFLADPVAGDGARIGYATSSGAACAPTWEQAVLSGLLELCERDAFTILWACRLSLPLLDWSAHPDLCRIDRRYFARTGLDYAAIDMSAFHGLPSVLGVVRAPDDDPPVLAVGAGTATTIERAWFKALSEAFACRAAGRMLLARRRGSGRPDLGDIHSFDDHVLWWAGQPTATAARFLDASDDRVDVHVIDPLPSVRSHAIGAVLERIAAAGSTAYAVDAIAPDLRSLGLHVIKTLAPGLAMLDVAHGGRFLGSPRLTHAAADRGLLPRPLAPDELNSDPHPFP
jgi:ribosomal protein S12 methylthiotransferase accessory factor